MHTEKARETSSSSHAPAVQRPVGERADDRLLGSSTSHAAKPSAP